MTEAQRNTIRSYDETAEQFSKTIGKLENYNHTYDSLIENLRDGSHILDLACGPAQISAYIRNRKNVRVTGVDLSEKMLEIARRTIPDGVFYRRSIIDFEAGQKYEAVIIGFGLPYLDSEQAAACLENAVNRLTDGGQLYVSFMQGNHSRTEKTSFGGAHDFFIYYHDKKTVTGILRSRGLELTAVYELDYTETDGSLTTDVVLIGKKRQPDDF